MYTHKIRHVDSQTLVNYFYLRFRGDQEISPPRKEGLHISERCPNEETVPLCFCFFCKESIHSLSCDVLKHNLINWAEYLKTKRVYCVTVTLVRKKRSVLDLHDGTRCGSIWFVTLASKQLVDLCTTSLSPSGGHHDTRHGLVPNGGGGSL